MGPEEALDTANRFASSDDSAVITAVIAILRSAEELITEEQRGAFSRLVGRMLGDKVKKLGWSGPANEDEEPGLMRSIVLPTMLLLGDDRDLDREARRLAMTWLTGGERPAILTPGVIRAVGAKADTAVFNALEHAIEDWPNIADRPLSSFSGVREPELVLRALNWILVTKRPAPERFMVLNSLGSRQETGPLLWTFVQQNYDALVNRLPELQSIPVGTRVISTLGRLCTTQARQEVQSFFAERSATPEWWTASPCANP